MGMLRVLSRRGDDRVAWDLKQAELGELDALAAVEEAERIFAAERERGATAFKLESGKSPVRIDVFDKTSEHIVMVPRVVGG
jgi:hypothetical protein